MAVNFDPKTNYQKQINEATKAGAGTSIIQNLVDQRNAKIAAASATNSPTTTVTPKLQSVIQNTAPITTTITNKAPVTAAINSVSKSVVAPSIPNTVTATAVKPSVVPPSVTASPVATDNMNQYNELYNMVKNLTAQQQAYKPIDNTKTINAGYDSVLQSTIQSIKDAVAQAKLKQQQIITDAPGTYNKLKNTVYGQSMSGLPTMNENIANLGVSGEGGYSRTEQAKANSDLQNQLSGLDAERQNVINTANQEIASLEAQGQFDEANATKEVAQSKLQAILQESARLDSMGYNASRDTVTDTNNMYTNLYNVTKDNATLKQQDVTNNAIYGGEYNGKPTADLQQSNITNQAQYGGTYNGADTIQKQQLDVSNTATMAGLTGEIKNADGTITRTLEGKQFDLSVENSALDNELKKSQITGQFNPYYNVKIDDNAIAPYVNNIQSEINKRMAANPNDPLIEQLQAYRANKILSSPTLNAQYGKEFETLAAEQFNFTKAAEEWKQKFDTEQFTYQKAQDQILLDFEKQKEATNNKFKNREITLAEKTQRDNQSIALKQLNLESAKFAWSKSKASSGSSSGGSSSGSGPGAESAHYGDTVGAINNYLKGTAMSDKDANGAPRVLSSYMNDPYSVPYQRVAEIIANSDTTPAEKKQMDVTWGIKPK